MAIKIVTPKDAMLLGIASRYPKLSQGLLGKVKADDKRIGEAADVLARDEKSGSAYRKHKTLVDSIRGDIRRK
jgi:hypothetical protein